ncbi:MAG: hypothetical protein H7039_01565 [Bryobacteraceae bacterium]|nr:hypothetical protein [Bryobacteraceae bacterium]
MQFFHDADRSAMAFSDIAFASASRGVAVGLLGEKNRTKPIAMVTSNGGKVWTQVPLRETPVALFFFDESAGWMVTDRGIWFTDEAGRSWRKQFKQRGLLAIRFVSQKRGWAVGAGKLVVGTDDGGVTWKRVPAALEAKGNRDYTAFTGIDFATPRVGMVVGQSRPPRRNEPMFPLWMDPEAESRREWPSLMILLETRDGGTTWRESVSSVFGRISRLVMKEDRRGLALIEFDRFFDRSSDVVSIDLRTGNSASVFRRKERAITDIALVADGPAFAAGFEVPGILPRTPVPGKLKIVRSDDLKTWVEGAVDYRAVATRVRLAVVDGANAWAATDTGMILHLRPN